MFTNGDIRAWAVSADMGLGHQRAANPLSGIAEEGILTAGSESVCSPKEKKLWDKTRHAYEFLSRVRSIPIIGKPLLVCSTNSRKSLRSIPCATSRPRPTKFT